MKIIRIYAGSDGESHFEDVEVELFPTDEGEKVIPITAIKGAQLRRTPKGGFWNFHRADSRKYIFMLGGQVEIGVGGGENRIFSSGDVLLVEDTAGRGHTLRVLGDQDRLCADIKLAD